MADITRKVNQWQKLCDDHKEKQMINPFSAWEGAAHRQKLDRDDPNYGRPVEGSMTEYRGRKAGELISGEILELCHVIADLGQRNADASFSISFGQLFEAYTTISNKLVGMLMRARKQKLLTFPGEMLFQRRDDDVIITLFNIPDTD
ncbi:actin-binding Rho-activating protein-like [Ostrea edulis]|uniref:actin-binding Rho-activating protein-like n=1 Tax=Ostrea edulis TaxID=37623 RepID=UPI00209626E1|nr:actin-binding Rho-activating protein-like [Ostrea edulis]